MFHLPLRMVPISSDTLKGFWGTSPRAAWALASLCPSAEFPTCGPRESCPAATCNRVSDTNSTSFLTRDGPSRKPSQLDLSSHYVENTQRGSTQPGELAHFKEPQEDEDHMRSGQASAGNVDTCSYEPLYVSRIPYSCVNFNCEETCASAFFFLST